MDQKKPLIIAISREFGSGGAYIGQQIARKRNMYYADSEIVAKAAGQFSANLMDVTSQEERVEPLWKSLWKYYGTVPNVYIPSRRIFVPTSQELFAAQSEIIKRIATEHSAVIIGRCGFHVLRDFPNRLDISLHADIQFRIRRIQGLYNITEEEATSIVKQSDKDRGLYISTFTGMDWTNSTLFDLSVNTGKIGINKSLELILDFIRLHADNA